MNHRYRSRRFILACFVLLTATAAMVHLVLGCATAVLALPVLSWWTTVASLVLGMYTINGLVDKKMKNGGE